MKVLWGDDDPSWTAKGKEIIQKYSPETQVDIVSSGDALVEFAKQGGYTFIVTDQQYAFRKSGIEAIREIREFDPKMPIYLLSPTPLETAAKAEGAIFISKNEFIEQFQAKNEEGVYKKYFAEYLR